MEELKKLVRIWKLNEQRNFWKTHSTVDDIVTALLQHAQQIQNYTNKKPIDQPVKPQPPSDLKPSSLSTRQQMSTTTPLKNFYGLKYFNREVDQAELAISSRFFDFPSIEDKVDNVVTKWRSEDFAMKEDLVPTDQLTSAGNGTSTGNSGSGGHSKGKHNHPMVAGMRSKAKLVKQRNLALHLMNYSAHLDFKKTQFSVKSVQTFINVSECDDSKTVSYCMVAISNIAAEPVVRNILFEINAMHKITNMLQHLKGKAAHWAAAILFYYFSCDKETEDRVYSAAHGLLQANGASKDPQARLVALYSLNNLMPCIDRQRVAELIMRILLNFFDSSIIFQDRELAILYLTMMQNMSWFSNVQHVLVNLNIFPLLLKFAQYAINNSKDKASSSSMAGDIAVAVGKILQAFIQLPEQAVHLVNDDFMTVLITLLQSDNDVVLLQAVRVSVSLSSLFNLRDILERSNLTKFVCDMLIARPHLSGIFAREASRYLVNITVLKSNHQQEVSSNLAFNNSNSAAGNTAVPMTTSGPSLHLDSAVGSRYLDANVPDAIFCVLRSNNTPVAARASVTRALQNIVAYSANAMKLVGRCMEPMVKLLRDPGSDLHTSLAAGYVLYNLSCVPECRSDLVDSKIHVKVLEFVTSAKDGRMKSAFLQILVQLTSSNVCVKDLLKVDLIKKVEQLLTVTHTSTVPASTNARGNQKETVKTTVEVVSLDVRRDISLMLLAVVAYAAADLPREGQVTTLQILNRICREPDSDDDIVENCANVLKFISAHFENFEELDQVVRCILDRGSVKEDDNGDGIAAAHISGNSGVSNAEIADCISTVLYNMTCSERSVTLMLSDSTYVNVMIRILRTGKLHVQENIAHAMRTLCAVDKCAQLLLKEDILSDLVVIALLRTSSEEIKVICSEAFYNMLCHDPSRLDLLKGDLWWALMRLGRTDSQPVRAICVRALSDLSAPVDTDGATDNERVANQLRNMQALRDHHVLSFIRDLSTASTPDLLQTCLQVVHNLMTHFHHLNEAPPGTYVTTASSFSSNGFSGSRTAYSRRANQQMSKDQQQSQQQQQQQLDPAKALQNTIMHEAVAAIRIAVDAFNRAPNIKCMRVALLLMLKCAQMRIPGCENEFVVLDVVESLRNKKKQWILHPECRVYVSRLCYELARHPALVKVISLTEMGDCLAGTILLPEGANAAQKTLPPTAVTAINMASSGDVLEMVENALSVLMSYLSVCATAAATASSQAAAAAAAAAAGLAKGDEGDDLVKAPSGGGNEGALVSGTASSGSHNAVAATASTAATSTNLLDVMQIIVGLEMWPTLLQEGLSTDSKILPKSPALGLGALVALLQMQRDSQSNMTGGATPQGGGGGNGSNLTAKRKSVAVPTSGFQGLSEDMSKLVAGAGLQPHPPVGSAASTNVGAAVVGAAGAARAPRQTIHVHTTHASLAANPSSDASSTGPVTDALQSVMTANAMALLNNNSSTATAILQGAPPLPLRVQAMTLSVLSYVIEVQLHQMSLPNKPSASPVNANSGGSSMPSTPGKPAVGSGIAAVKNSVAATQQAAAAQQQAAQLAAAAAAAAAADRGPAINGALIQGIVRQDLLDHPATRHSVLAILHAVSRHPLVAGHLVTPEFFQLIDRFVASTVGSSRFDRAQEFATSILRHLALTVQVDANGTDVASSDASAHGKEHASLSLSEPPRRPGSASSSSSSPSLSNVATTGKGRTIAHKLVALPNRVLLEFVRDLVETLSGRDIEQAAVNIAVFFYHMAHFLVYSEQQLNLKFVLDMIAKMSANEQLDKEKSVARHINQYTISMILNQYSFSQGVDPAFVQHMLQSFQNQAVQQAPETVAAMQFHVIGDLSSSLAHPLNFANLTHILNSPLASILTKLHPSSSSFSASATTAIVASAPVTQAALSLCTSASIVALLSTMKDLLSFKTALLVILEKFPANYDQWQAVLICDIKKNETVILKLSSPKPVMWHSLDLYLNNPSSSSGSAAIASTSNKSTRMMMLGHSQSERMSGGGGGGIGSSHASNSSSSNDLLGDGTSAPANGGLLLSAAMGGSSSSSYNQVSHFHGVVHVYHKILRHFDAVSDSMVMLGKSSKSLAAAVDGGDGSESGGSGGGSSSAKGRKADDAQEADNAAGGAGKNAGTITEGDEEEEEDDEEDDEEDMDMDLGMDLPPELTTDRNIPHHDVTLEEANASALTSSHTTPSPSPPKRTNHASNSNNNKGSMMGVPGADVPDYSDTETEGTDSRTVRSGANNHNNHNNSNHTSTGVSVPATPVPTVITGSASHQSFVLPISVAGNERNESTEQRHATVPSMTASDASEKGPKSPPPVRNVT
jgi:hypothetical protein